MGYRLKILLKPSVFILGLHQQIHNVFTTITSMGSKKPTSHCSLAYQYLAHQREAHVAGGFLLYSLIQQPFTEYPL